MEPRAPTGEQLHSLSGSGHSVVAVRGSQAHQPRELAKRYLTQFDRRAMTIAIDAAVAAALGIAGTYTMRFEYRFDSDRHVVQNFFDSSNGATMTFAASVIAEEYDNGVDIAIPAMVGFVASAGARLLATFAWGARLRTDVSVVAGMALVELEIVTLQGINRIAPGVYSWTFDQGSLPP